MPITLRPYASDWVRTLAAAKTTGVQVVVPRVGERFEFGQPFDSQPWYLPPAK